MKNNLVQQSDWQLKEEKYFLKKKGIVILRIHLDILPNKKDYEEELATIFDTIIKNIGKMKDFEVKEVPEGCRRMQLVTEHTGDIITPEIKELMTKRFIESFKKTYDSTN